MRKVVAVLAGPHVRVLRARQLRLVPPNSVAEATSGVLTFTVRDGNVVEHELTPTLTQQDGRPRVVEGETADEAIAAWDELRACTGLESGVEMG
ncbi:MAG TPA: hypothetical protein VFZ63_03170 [Jiangellaceae bacterium]